ncbi:MAG: 3-methyl-2-oxobutanoate hydroxymethyltransferase [Verrucomicrobia bacterium]|nr:3-methyl-2-oxobutanoate hydroxymethyltransferase [Verrucomicrobiota bacterium]
MRSDKLSCGDIQSLKGREPIAVLTAYDHPTARLLDEAGIPILLVGDSLGMMVLGFPDTTHVTMEHMVHHVAAVARAHPKALIGADLPHLSYRTPEEGVANARRLLEAGADFVKAEGGQEILSVVKAIRAAGIPFCGHLGMLPQHIHEEGGKYRIKGRDEAGRQRLLDDARYLEEAGAFACVLELVTPPVTAEITRTAGRMVTIGIGSGPDCDGQVLVTPDLIGSFPWFTPKFIQPRLQVSRDVQQAVSSWKAGLVLPGTGNR